MQTKTILIGGQKAVPIPEAMLEQCPLGDEVDVSVCGNALVVRPQGRNPREGWEEAARLMHERGDDEPLDILSVPNEFDESEWEWKE